MKTQRLLAAMAVAGFALMTASTASALPLETWVSGTGSDSTGTGTRSNPYATFAQAVSETAPGGTILVASPGDFGSVTITQSITIDGNGGGADVTFAGDGEGIYVDTPPGSAVVLRDLTINGLGTGSDGVFYATTGTAGSAAAYLTIDNCLITGFTDIGIGVGSESPEYVSITNTTIAGGGLGELGVRTFQSNPLETPNDFVTMRNDTITGITGGVDAAAIFTRDGSLDVSGSTISQNYYALENDTGARIYADNNIISNDNTAVATWTGAKSFISNNDIYNDIYGIAPDEGVVLSAGNNKTAHLGTGTAGAPSGSITVY